MNKSESKYFNTSVKFDKALLSLLERKSFEYITVREICEEAEVNRSTFYLHYENTCDLLEEATKYVMNDFTSCFSVDSKNIAYQLTKCKLHDLYFVNNKYLTPYLTYIKEHQRIFSAVLSNSVTFKFESIFQKLFDNIFDPILDRFSYPADERKYVMMFYLNGITAIVVQWIKDGCGKSTDEIAEVIRYCIFGRENSLGLNLEK